MFFEYPLIYSNRGPTETTHEPKHLWTRMFAIRRELCQNSLEQMRVNGLRGPCTCSDYAQQGSNYLKECQIFRLRLLKNTCAQGTRRDIQVAVYFAHCGPFWLLFTRWLKIKCFFGHCFF